MREDWVECTFEDLTKSLKRGPFGGDLKKAYFVSHGHAVYEQQHAIADDFSNMRYFIDDERYRLLKACSVGPGDYIVSCSGTMGKIARLPENAPKGVINQALLRIRINEEIIHHSYFLEFFKSSIFQKKILKDSRGSGMQNMAGIKEIKPINIEIPPLPEQRAIVAKIEELFSDLDKGIADLNLAKDQLKVYRQAVLKKAFMGEFTKKWRKFQDDVLWREMTFEGITESLKRGPFGGDLKKEYFVDEGYSVYEQQHAISGDFSRIRYFINKERFHLLKACNVGPGDYIVSCSGTMGKIARLPEKSPKGIINQALLRIRINENIIEHNYFMEFFRSQIFQRLILQESRGSGMQNMAGIKEIKPIPINLPSIKEQKQIIKEIESRLSVCDKVEQSITESLEKAKALRQSILKKAFEGTLLTEAELAKCKEAPDYEPASVLLERIKKEKK